VFYFVSCLALILSLARPQDTLRDAVRRHGDVGVSITIEYEPASIADLTGKADLIARVLIQGETVRLSSDETSVETDYAGQIIEPIRPKYASSALPPVIEITRPGGTLILDGHSVHSSESDFPRFELGAEYVFFLKRAPNGSFSFPYGAQGAFKIENGTVAQMSRHNAAWRADHGGAPVPIAVLLGEIDAVKARH